MKKLSLLVLTLAVLIFAFSAFAHDMVKNGNAVPTDNRASKITKPGKSGIMKTAADEPIVWSDDFESMDPHWVPDASWAKTALGDGRAYQPVSAWSLTDQNSSSPTHSWHAVEGNEELDFLVSPVISLPTEVETAGVMSELKGLKLGFNFDIDTPDGNSDADQGENLKYLVGPEEVLWTLSGEDVAAGNSAHYLNPTQGSTDMHWRQWLVSPEIDLTGATGTVNLTFSQDYQNETAFDYYAVDISTDDFLSYTNLGFFGETGTSDGWLNESFDISAYVGQVVKIRFSSKGDYGTAEGFWAVDEIKVTDDTGDLFYDDGGEDGTTEMVASGFFGPDVSNGYDPEQVLWSNAANPTPNWLTLDPPLEVVGFKTNFGPGSDVRLVFWWNSDDDEPQGRGLFIDDVNLFGVGLLPNDLAVSGIKGLMTAALGKPFAPEVGITNVGINPQSGNVIWTGTILDQDSTVVHVLTNTPTPITDFAMDSTMWSPTLPARAWIPMKPGYYTLAVKLIFPDGDPTNNEASFDVFVPGGPWATPLYRCDFEPTAGQTSLEDFGWTVVNGGGNDSTGLNVNKWEYIGFLYGDGAATLSAFWGNVDPGPDVVAPLDSSEVLDEYIISPAIDVSMVGKHNTLGLQYFEYFRSGYGTYADFGVATSQFTIDWSVDGQNWVNAFTWVDDDSLPGNGPRLPNYFFGMDNPIPYYSKLDLDITPALLAAKRAGSNTIQIRFGTSCENSYFVASSVDEIMVYAGIAQPMVMEVRDVPNDQGKQVYMVLKGSMNDMVYNWANAPVGDVIGLPVTQYQVWRGTDMPGAGVTSFASFQEMFNTVTSAHVGDKYMVNDVVWDFVKSFPAADKKVYGAVLPTLWDGTETPFMVVARTNNPTVWSMSVPANGTSEDNLAPAAPGALAVTSQDGGTTNTLGWDEAYTPVNDVKYYTIYRSTESGAAGEVLSTTTDLSYVDATGTMGTEYYYTVTATDFAGNESDKSNEGSVITSVEGQKSGIPTDFALDQNYPNPFNPTTTVEYAVPQAGRITLTIYNAAGQAITTLYNGYQSAGYHKVSWDATNASAGIYFLEMRTSNFNKMIKMTLLK